jgi:hypothetical protein
VFSLPDFAVFLQQIGLDRMVSELFVHVGFVMGEFAKLVSCWLDAYTSWVRPGRRNDV